MKIAQIICAFPPYRGGMGNVAYVEAEELVKLGHEVSVFTVNRGIARDVSTEQGLGSGDTTYGVSKKRLIPKDKKITGGALTNQNFKIIRLKPLIKYGNAAFLPQLIFKLKKFDVVQLHYPFFGAVELVWLAKEIGLIKNLVIFYHMDFMPKNLFFKILSLPAKIILRLLLDAADKVIVSSLDYANHASVKKYFEKNKSKFIEIPFGSRFAAIEPGSEARLEQEKVILFVGGLDKAHYFKGVSVLLKAFQQILKYREQVKLIIVGDGDLRFEYQARAKKLKIQDKIHFVGQLDDRELKAYYAGCDVFVLPSINSGEAFGLVLIEAMSFAKPVIAADLPGVRTVCRDNENGFLVKPGDADDLADKLKIILSDNGLRREMGKKGQKMVEEKYNWQKHGEKLGQVYKEVVGKTINSRLQTPKQ